jgi:hypothetical protein
VVLKLLPSAPTAAPIPHILKRAAAHSNTLTILKPLHLTTAEATMLRYGEIERLCEGLTAYYRPCTKRKQFARLFRDAYERTGMRLLG